MTAEPSPNASSVAAAAPVHHVVLARPDDFEGWRDAARGAALAGIAPERIVWSVAGGQGDLLGAADTSEPHVPDFGDRLLDKLSVKPEFMEMAKAVVCHRDPERFSLLYRLLVRSQDDRDLVRHAADPDVHRAETLHKAIRRDAHKMHAFVRFRKVEREDGDAGPYGDLEQFVAWFEPDHFIVRRESGFFTRRFANMIWSILTPYECMHWDGKALEFTPGVDKSAAPTGDSLEEYWRTYYASIFNPARLKIAAMRSEMPKKYWHNLPEAEVIPQLVREAQTRETEMIRKEGSVPRPSMMAHREIVLKESAPDPDDIADIPTLKRGLEGCRNCALWKPATQAVPGHGNADARVMFVGEAPGDQEDLAGEPFVGPAGRLFDDVLHEVGIDRDDTYVTNAVKHFKYEPRGRRRLHKTPSDGEIDACQFWLMKEIELVRPDVIVAMGNSAYRGLTGQKGKVMSMRGKPMVFGNQGQMIMTVHPSYVLRVPDDLKAGARQGLVDDLRVARKMLDG